MTTDNFRASADPTIVIRTVYLPADLDAELAKLSDPRNRVGYNPVTGLPDPRYRVLGGLAARRS